MSKVTRMVLDRIVDRCAAIVAGIVGSTINTICVRQQAEHQGELEDLATQYEKAGKLEAADTLRKHAHRLSENNPAQDAIAITDNLLNHQDPCFPPVDEANQQLALPHSPPKPRGRRKRTKSPVVDS